MPIVKIDDLFGSTRKKVEVLTQGFELPESLSWGPETEILTDEVKGHDTLMPGRILVFKVVQEQWCYINVSQVDENGFGVYWDIEVDSETGKVFATAHPLVRPLVRPTKHSNTVSSNLIPEKQMGCESREIGQIEPLVQVFSNELCEVFPQINFDQRWMERSGAVKVFQDLISAMQVAWWDVCSDCLDKLRNDSTTAGS